MRGISKYFVTLNGGLVNNIVLGDDKVNWFTGVKPVYDLEVKTYRDYLEKELVVNLPGAGQLKEKLAKENPDYFVYRNIQVERRDRQARL